MLVMLTPFHVQKVVSRNETVDE